MKQGGQYGEMGPQGTLQASSTSLSVATVHMMGVDNQLVEEASPISSRPPAGNLDELMHDEDEAGHRGGGGCGISGGTSGNRWPKQETLALLRIRSDMDVAFKEAPLKGLLWEDVSRKLAELGYKRSAKKCKEKFENVHKYYKRTKEGRAGRQDGKSYKFFSELEALQTTTNTNTFTATTTTASLAMATSPHVNINPSASSTNFVSLGFGISTTTPILPISSVQVHPTITSTRPSQVIPSSTNIGMSTQVFHPSMTAAETTPPTILTQAAAGISFSSNSTSSSQGTEDDNNENVEMVEGSSRKRKRASMCRGGSNGSRGMMEFFENLMKQVMQKQEAMQQRFLEAIEKREQDRLMREEAWKRQEMDRVTREHEIIAQERAIAAQRDAAIITFIQKINGQTIQLPQHASVMPSAAVAAPPPPQPARVPTPAQTPPQAAPLPPHQKQPPQEEQVTPKPIQQKHQSQTSPEVVRQTSSRSTDVVMAVPEQQVLLKEASGGGGGSYYQPSSSRWPKEEIIALINLRSGLETRYHEAGPKGPLWEEISAGMARLGYNRNAKRCKEKWENINKYYKKVKESNKQRPEDAKTCPYFHQLDTLYRQKLLGNTSSGGGSSSTSGIGNENRPQQHGFSLDSFPSATKPQDMSNIQMNIVQATQPSQAPQLGSKNGSSGDVQTSNLGFPGSLFGEETGGAAQKPEDINVKELMDQQQSENHEQLTVDDYEKIDEPDHSDHNLDQDDYEEDEDDDVELEDQRKMAYKIEFQRQSNAAPPNGGRNGTPSFLAMVQ